MYKSIFILSCIFFISCLNEKEVEKLNLGPLREEVIVENNVFKVSYNENKQQPNWIEYKVRNITKVADRDGMDFYLDDNVRTSDNMDYKNNPWDKGHMAPAGSFTDSWENLYTTFSFLNCALQLDQLNRGEWRELEEQNRLWAKEFGTLNIKIELKFSENSKILDTDAYVPDGFYKHIIFPNNSKKCFYFPNQKTQKNWTEYEISCN